MGIENEYEAEFLNAFKNGDPKAIGDLVSEYFVPLSYFTNSIMRNLNEAQEIVNDVFLKTWQFRDRFNSLSALKAFMYVSCRNAAYDYWRLKSTKKVKMIVLLNDWGIFEVPSVDEEATVDRLEEAELFKQLYRAIPLLPQTRQNVIVLTIQGFSNTEIAAKLGIAEQSVRNAKTIAIANLKEIIRR